MSVCFVLQRDIPPPLFMTPSRINLSYLGSLFFSLAARLVALLMKHSKHSEAVVSKEAKKAHAKAKTRVLARTNRLKPVHWPDRTNQYMGIGQTEQTDIRQAKKTDIWVLAWPNRPKNWYWSDGTDRNKGIGQTKQIEIRVLARPNKPKIGIGQKEQTEIWVLARRNRPK